MWCSSSACDKSCIFLFLKGASLYTHALPCPRWRHRWQTGFSCPHATLELRHGLHAAFFCGIPGLPALLGSMPHPCPPPVFENSFVFGSKQRSPRSELRSCGVDEEKPNMTHLATEAAFTSSQKRRSASSVRMILRLKLGKLIFTSESEKKTWRTDVHLSLNMGIL